jgi:ubiquinone/menaquinone biosynthesis C-methylase UbiE
VCCGTGASAIPAAQAVGPSGRVIGVDVAENLLEQGGKKSQELGLSNLSFECADMLKLNFAPGTFDAVICVFGIFFVPDMPGAVQELWRMVSPEGQLAITTWGPNVFEPANGSFWEAVRKERPDLYKGFNPWDRISDPASVQEMLRQGGVEECATVAESGTHELKSPEDWWTIVLGSGYRGTVEQLAPDARERVREANLKYLQEKRALSIEANVIFALARKNSVPIRRQS